MSNIRVAVRVRPLSDREKEKGSREIIEVNDTTVTIENVKVLGIPEFGDSRTKLKAFSYDHCYNCLSQGPAYATQDQVFQDLGTQVLTSALDGFNACVFAYGQTGTGKTHTMMGYPGDMGLIPRICEGLFQSISSCADPNVTCRVDVSYFEIYKEKVRDLLQMDLVKQICSEKPSLRVREHPKDGPYVQGLSWHRVREYTEVQDWLDRGNTQRVTAETYIHGRSSRSHAIVNICFTQARLEENRPSEIVSKIHLVDLAGSEKADPSSKPGFRKRLTEGSHINRSLVALGYVIKALAEKSLLSWSSDEMGSTQSFHGSGGGESQAGGSPSAGQGKQLRPFIPYRDSPLTYLLKDSLGGNSKTIMIATITPASEFYSETLSTLRYAQRAKNIINKPRVNEDSNVSLIRELRREIERLREMLVSAQKPMSPCEDIMYFVPSLGRGRNFDQGGEFVSLQDSEDTIIAEKLHENEEMAKQLTQSWMGKWSSTHDIMKETDLSIRNLRNRNSSMGVMIDSQLPYLVGMDDDVLSTGVVIFHLKEGDTTVGRDDADTAQDIVLMGPNIQQEHCVIHHDNGEVRVHPLPGAMCSIQGLECTEPTRLAQGDYVAFGGDQVFRFNNPAEAAKLRENRRSQGSLNTLNTSYMSFGGLSRASSYSSLGTDDSNFLSPNSQLGRSYPNYAASDLCHELERKHQSEHDRIAEARRKLEHLHEEHERAEEARQEQEEEMYAHHEQHRADIDAQRQQLARLIQENERARQKADEEIQLARDSLAKEKEAFQKELDDQRRQLKELQKRMSTDSSGTESSGMQTEPLSMKTSSTEALGPEGVSVGIDDVDGTEKGEQPAKKQRRQSVDEQLRELEAVEFSRRMSYRETEESLSIQQEDLEDQYQATQDKIEARRAKIHQAEEEYRQMDEGYLQQMSQQTAVVDALHKQEVQLEVYIQENEELQNVSRDVPRPLRSACSEMHLEAASLLIPEYPQKTSSLRNVSAAQDKNPEMSTPQIKVQSASAESVKSEPVTMTTDSKPQKAESKLKKEKKPLKDITSVARDVTSRLYQPPEPKFKYVPKAKEKDVSPAGRPARVRDCDGRARSSPSRFFLEHSPSPQRSEHSPSPLRQTGKRLSPSPARDQLPKRGPSPKPTKPPVKKGTPKDGGGKPKGKDSKVMAVRNKPEAKKKESSTGRAESPGSRSDGSVSPDRLSPVSGNRLPAAKLRHIASASSLASVPESVSEEADEAAHKQRQAESVNYVVKRRAKKGRSCLFDDEFRTQSAPDSQNMEKALDDYTLQMISGLPPGRQDSERVLPVYTTSVSVDDADLTRDVDSENRYGEIDSDKSLPDNEEQNGDSSEQAVQQTDADTVLPSVVLGKRDHDSTESFSERQTSPPVSPRKRSKSEGDENEEDWCDDRNENAEVFDNMDAETAKKDSSFSDDSLNNSNVSADSLESEDKHSRLTQSLPAYLLQDEKPPSDDCLNDSLEEKRDATKEEIMEVEQLDSKTGYTDSSNDTKNETVDNKDHKDNKIEMNDVNIKPKPVLTKSEIKCCDFAVVETKSKPTLSKVALPPIDIVDGPGTNAETMTEQGFNCEDSQIQTMDTDNPDTVSETDPKYTTAPQLTIVNLPSVSFTDEFSEEDDKAKSEADNHITADTNDSNQKNDDIRRETVDKVKQYVEEVVDSAKEKYLEEKKNEAESAIELETAASSDARQTQSAVKVRTDAISEVLPKECLQVKTENELLTNEQEVANSAETAATQANEPMEAVTENKSDIEPMQIDTEQTSVDTAETQVNEPREVVPENKSDTESGVQIDTEQIGVDTSETKTNETKKAVPEIKSDTEPDEEVTDQTKPEQVNKSKAKRERVDGPDHASAAEMESSDTPVTGEATTGEPATRSIGVGTSLECLVVDEGQTGVQGSDDSLIDPKKELQVLQDALDQLPARSCGSGPQLSTARRAARQRAMIRQQQQRSAPDSDGVEPASDESPASENLSKSSSRPGSGSRRRRRPQSKLNDKTKPRTDHTSDDYDSSENDSVYSEESLDDKLLGSRAGECQNGNVLASDQHNFVIPDSLENSDTDEMSRLFNKPRGRHSSKSKQRQESTEIEEGPDGKRNVGIQTHDPYRHHNTRPDLSDFDGSFVSGDSGRNMAVSPISLWTTDRSEEGKDAGRNSTSSSGVVRAGNEAEKSMTATPRSTPRSSARSYSSVFLENSCLDRGTTEIWSNSDSDLRPVPNFDDDISYVMETECMIPTTSPFDLSEDAQNNGVFGTSPREMTRPECSTPKNSGRTVSITYPESQVEKAASMDYNTPVTFEVTVHEESTNVLYNVEKTEYKTYGLRNDDQNKPKAIPDTIHVNLTEKVSSKTEEKLVSDTSENVKLEMPQEGDKVESGILESEKAVRSSYSSERETETKNDQVRSEIVKEDKECIEDNTQYKVPSNSSCEEPVKVKRATLQQSGLVEATNYPGDTSDMPQHDLKATGELNTMDESDYTSDYGTFISTDGRRCSDSDSDSPGISPRTSHVSKQKEPESRRPFAPILPLETSLESTDLLDGNISPRQSQQVCSSQDVVTPMVIAARTEQSSPVQFMHNPALEASNGISGSGPRDNDMDNVDSFVDKHVDELDETDSGSCSTVKPLIPGSENTTCFSQETLNDLEAETVDKLVEVETEKMASLPVEALHSSRNDKSSSSADDLFISLDQTGSNSSTCSSDYRTPRQSPRDGENNETSDQVANVVIPDLHDDMSISSTPRVEEEVSAIQGPVLTSSPKVPPSVRTISVNTENPPAANSISPQSARVREVFGGPNDPIHTESTRREIEAKISRLQHNVRSLSDSAISSDYTDCDSSSPRGNKLCETERKSLKKPTGKPSVKSSDSQTNKNTELRRTLDFEGEGVKKSPFKDSGSILDEETIGTSDEEYKNGGTEPSELIDMKATAGLLPSSGSKHRCQFLPAVGPIGKFPETIVGAVLAIKPYPLQRSASLDSIATLVNTGTSLSRAARESQSIEDIHAMPDGPDKGFHKNKQIAMAVNGEVDENENLLSSCGLDSQYSDRPLSPGEIGIEQGSIDDMVKAVDNEGIAPDTELPVASANAKLVPEKATSMSFLDEKHNPEYHRSLSEGHIDDLDDANDTSCTSNDSITFVFVGKEFQNNGENASEYTNYKDDENEDSDPANTRTYDAPRNMNISARGHHLVSSDDEGGAVLSRSASGESVSFDSNTEDEVSTHSASEEIREIIECKNQTSNQQSQPCMREESPPTYTDASGGLISHKKEDVDDEDSAPLRHRFGIDESVLPIVERSVSADNIPKHVISYKDMNRSRSTSMLDMAAAENEESESGIFPPALSYVDEDQTEPSVSLRTMSEGALEQISQMSLSDRAVTSSDQTSSELQSSGMDESSSANIHSVCSNTSSIEEIVEEYAIQYASNDKRFAYTTPQTGDPEDDEQHLLEEEEHIKEVLKTVEKFFMPMVRLVDKGTTTDPEDIVVKDVPDDQSPTSDSGTQTAGNDPTMLQPNQIMLPALSAPFRAQSVESFGLGRHGQDIKLSEGAENWCTLGELMIETTHLLRTINDKLPNLDKSESVSSAESQAILKQWQEISIQTGDSLNDMHTVGLQTDENQFNDNQPSKITNGATQTTPDKKSKLDRLEISQTFTDELVYLPPLTLVISDEDEDSESDLSEVEEVFTPSQQASQFASPIKQDESIETKSKNLLSTEENDDEELTGPNSSISVTSPESKESVCKAKFKPQVKAELGLDKEDKKQTSPRQTDGSHKTPEISPRSKKSALTLPNTPEMEELRKEHNKLMENLRKASDNRKARKDAIHSRKQVPLNLELNLDKEDESLNNSIDAEMPQDVSDTSAVSDDMNRPDCRSSVSSSLTSPQEIVKINIQSDPNEGITIENTVFKERKRKTPKNDHPDETHTHSWNLFNEPKKLDTETRPRASSGSSVSSSDTCVSLEVAKVMSSPPSEPKTYTDERDGALNPAYLDEETTADENESIDSDIGSVVEDSILPRAHNRNETVPSAKEGELNDSNGTLENEEPREKGVRKQPVFIKSETSPKLKSANQGLQPSTSPELPETVGAVDEPIVPDEKLNQKKLPAKHSLLKEDFLPKKDAVKDVLPNEDMITPETHSRDFALPPVLKESSKPTESQKNESSSEDESVVEDIVEPVAHQKNHSLPPLLAEAKSPEEAKQATHSKPQTVESSDDGTQASVELSDDCTQTDRDSSIESTINQDHILPVSNKPAESRKSLKEKPAGEEQKTPENLKNELEKLHDQRKNMIEMMGMSHMPPSLTVELLEAKLNYCIGQTDLLLDNLEDNVNDPDKQLTNSPEQQKARDYIEQYRADLKKSKEDIDECREKLKNRREIGVGRGRTPYRKSDLQWRAQLDAFKLERMREQQDYHRAKKYIPNRGNTPLQGNTPLRGNTPMMGNSPVVTPRSERSRSSSPNYSPGYMTPREHKAHLQDLRKQLIADVMEDESRHRSESPSLRSPPRRHPPRPRDGSLGFSPKTSVSSDYPERTSPTYNTFAVPPVRSPTSPQRIPFNHYSSLGHSRYPDAFDTRTEAEGIYSPEESAAMLQDMEDYKRRVPNMSTPMEEMLRRSSFSSTGSQRSDSSRKDPFSSPRSLSDSRKSSPGALQPDYSQPLSLNLDSLNDDNSQPYSPYSAYARECVLPRERSPVGSGGVVRGTYELYHSRSNSQSDSSSVLSFGSDPDTSHRPRINSLDEDTVKRLRPVRADDIKARLGRHKR